MEKAKVFVIMPFADEFFESYEMIKTHFESEFEFSHAGEEDNQQNILADIIPPIYNADIVLADLTGLNANVMYELGIAHSFNKKTIVITRDEMSKLPFDLKQYRAKGYSTHFKQFYDLLAYLDKHFHGAIDGSVVFNNPVGDFLDKNKIDPKDIFTTQKIGLEIPNDEKGYIDFLADIEADANTLTSHILSIHSELNTMNNGINTCLSEVKRVKKTGGSGNTSFVRKQTSKAADYIADFSRQLKDHNTELSRLWTGIEKDVLGLLENSFTAQDGNKMELIKFLKSLHSVRNAIDTSNISIRNMKEASKKNIGLERSLNQAIRFLDTDLEDYLSITEQMKASIERILSKSKFVVGDLDFAEETPNN